MAHMMGDTEKVVNGEHHMNRVAIPNRSKSGEIKKGFSNFYLVFCDPHNGVYCKSSERCTPHEQSCRS